MRWISWTHTGAALGVAAAVAIGSLLTAPEVAAQDFNFSGDWAGTFEDRTEPERDMATRGGASINGRGGRDRMISGVGRFQCDGELFLTLRGQNQDLEGRGTIAQTCKGARTATWDIPPESVELSDFDFKDKGEGKDKELRFRFEVRYRTPPGETASNELIRCEAKGKYKPGDEVFEGDYSCRHTVRDNSTNSTMAIRIRGDFELRRDETG